MCNIQYTLERKIGRFNIVKLDNSEQSSALTYINFLGLLLGPQSNSIHYEKVCLKNINL